MKFTSPRTQYDLLCTYLIWDDENHKWFEGAFGLLLDAEECVYNRVDAREHAAMWWKTDLDGRLLGMHVKHVRPRAKPRGGRPPKFPVYRLGNPLKKRKATP